MRMRSLAPMAEAGDGRHPARSAVVAPREAPRKRRLPEGSLSFLVMLELTLAHQDVAPAAGRAQGMEVLRRPAEGGPRPCRRLVGRSPAARDPARGLRDRDGGARRRRAAWRSSRGAARLRGDGVRPAPGARADPPARKREPRAPRRVAWRPGGSKALRLFGLAAWAIGRFRERRPGLHDLQYAATRLRERPVVWSVLLVVSANVLVFWVLAEAAAAGHVTLGEAVVYVQSAIGVSAIAFGGFSWALDGAAAPVAAVLRLEPAMRPAGALRSGNRPADATPAREIRLRDVTFAYPAGKPALEHFDLTISAGSCPAIVGQNGAGKTTIAKLLCRLYDPQSGAIDIDGADIRELDLASWRSRVAAVFQDFIRLELPLRDNVAPAGAPDDVVHAALGEYQYKF